MDFPFKESVTKNEDDSYTIFINAKLSAEEQQKKFQHAMLHILEDDFYKENADKIEFDTHISDLSFN